MTENHLSSNAKLAKDGIDWFQRKAKGIEAGDIFSIPLPRGYGFGRVMNTQDGARIAEFFRFWQEDESFSEAISASGRLFSPIGIFLDGIAYRNRKRPWKVIAKNPNYYPDDLYEIPFLLEKGPGYDYGYFTLNERYERFGPVSQEDVDKGRVCSLLPQHPDMIAEMVEELLTELGIRQA
ncbi:Imm26 family immunity protein [Glycomyces tenuis]|uniref:Imm26 family immunity protein n=1 Tax=Glycomyces tenuis TaxID=58116 RepID=UPI0009DBFDF6|nr:Imm26 family immunity protein [Glycomyces tenuis]